MKNSEKYFNIVLMLIYVMAGVLGIMLSSVEIFSAVVREWTFIAVLICACAVFALQLAVKKYMANIGIMLLISAALYVLKRNEVNEYLLNIYNALKGGEGLENYDITYFAVALSVMVSEFVTGVVWEKRYSILYFILIMFVVFLNPLAGVKGDMVSVFLMLFSWGGIFMLNLAGKGRIKRGVKVSALIALCTGFIYISSGGIAYLLSDNIEDIAEDADGYIYRGLKEVMSQNSEDYDTGNINRGNNYQRGTPCVELWLSKKPEEDIYLKGFEGGNYKGGKWEEADESELFDRLAFERGWPRWSTYISNMYKEVYYAANSSSNPGITLRARTVTINPLLQNVKNRYYPYIGRWERITRKENIAYVYSFYELKDVHIDREEMDYENRRKYDDLVENYSPYVYDTYLSVPYETVPGIVKLCKGREFESIDEITKFIRQELSKRVYTLTPGMAPLNEDIVEYFMFESERGYCVHFASAAVLMYRCFGVPARYVTGYRVNSGDFKEQEDGTYYARALDRDAHAWPEIYVEDKGWIPVEVTPAAYYAGEDAEVEQNTQESTVEAVSEVSSEESTLVRAYDNEDKGVWRIGEAAVIAAFVILIWARRMLKLVRIKKYDTGRLFAVISSVISVKGENITGLEDDFEERIMNISTIQYEDALKLKNIILKNAYSGRKTSEKDRQFVYRMYRKISKDIYNKCSVLKKIYIKFIKAVY